ncbi:MAG: tetratricopeptide repeat protein [Sphingobacteriaceae bacterium]|nr:MAG: tetratricopeptide repeat protein [Sphingobacteriaceae bacterium]
MHLLYLITSYKTIQSSGSFWMNSKLITLLIISFEAACVLASAQPPPIVRKLTGDTAAVTALIAKGRSKSSINQPDSAELYYRKAGALAKKLNYYEGEVNYTAEYARFLYQQLRYTDALKISEQQLKVSLLHKDAKRIANAYNNIAIQYRVLGKLQLAVDNMLKALKTSENLNDSLNQRKYYSNLASIFLDLEDKKNSLIYATKGYEIAVKLKDSVQIARALTNLYVSETINNKYDRAIQHIKQVADIATKIKNTELVTDASVNLGNIYNQLNRHKEALQPFKNALIILDNEPSTEYELYTYVGLATSYNGLNNIRQARFYLNKAIANSVSQLPRNDLKEVYLLASSIYEKSNNLPVSLIYYKKYTSLNDSIVNANTQMVVHEADIKYQTSLKEKAIAQQKLQIIDKNYQLTRTNRYVLISAGIVVVLLFACALIYVVSRYKHQSIELSLLKSQLHPHFLFNTLNNLYALSLNKSDKSPGVVLGLAEILKYILYECNSASISLQKEIDIIKRYIELERVRYYNSLEINLTTRGNLSDCEIVPLLLLPLVENAFKHGISKLEEDGWINIEVMVQQQELTFRVSNNRLTADENSSKPAKYGNIGLHNIKKRLNILYHNSHSIEVIDDDEIFIVIMKISLKKDIKRKLLA